MPLTLAPDCHERTLSTLTELAALCVRAEASFRSGAEQAQADDVRALLRRRAEELRIQAADLLAHARRLGGSASPAPTAETAAWTLSRSVALNHVDVALLEACERSEDAALEKFTGALTQPLEPAARDVLQVQRMEMRRQHELLRTMRDRLSGLL